MTVHQSTQCEKYFPNLRELAGFAVRKSENMKMNETVKSTVGGSSNYCASTCCTTGMVDQSTQCEKYFPTLRELAGFAFRKSAVLSEADIRNIEHKIEVEKFQLSEIQKQLVHAKANIKKVNTKVGHYDKKNEQT
jgi:hypothetical protein